MKDTRPVLICDLGKVLIDYDPNIIINRLLPYTNWSAMDICNLFATARFLEEFEKGRFSEEDFFHRLRKILSISDEIGKEDLKAIWNSMFFPIKEMFSFIRYIAGKNEVRIFLLSNISITHYEFLYSQYEELSLFEQSILSYKVGFRKPEKGIFRFALELAGASKDVFFTDDREQFVYAARELGIDAFVFKGYQDFIKQLQVRPAINKLIDNYLVEQGAC